MKRLVCIAVVLAAVMVWASPVSARLPDWAYFDNNETAGTPDDTSDDMGWANDSIEPVVDPIPILSLEMVVSNWIVKYFIVPQTDTQKDVSSHEKHSNRFAGAGPGASF